MASGSPAAPAAAGITTRMNDSKFRSWLEAEWVRIDDAAAARKNLHGAIVGLSNLYRSLSANERQVADEVVIGWAESDDLKKRFDGLVLIDKFAITAAIPRLQQLAERLRDSTAPFAAYDCRRVTEVIGRLSRRRPEGDE